MGKVDFSAVWQIFFYALGVFWIVVLYWIWLDSGDRTSSKFARAGYVLLGLIFNVVGLIIYLIVRPTQTIEEIYWSDLERRYLKFETSELGDCPKCGAQLYPGFKFCPHCGEEAHKSTTFVSQTPTKEVMEEQIEASRVEAVSVVEESRTRYSVKKDVVMKVGESIIQGYKVIGAKFVALLSSLKRKEKDSLDSGKISETSKNNSKKKKNRKKRK